MAFTHIKLVALSAFVFQSALARDAFTFCTDGVCQDCPVSLTSAGTGYPQCVIYNTDDVFPNQGFPVQDSQGGYMPYLDIGEQDPECQVIVKTPANTDFVGCGYVIGSFNQPVCAQLELDTTFMVQFCCGRDDCKAAGATKRSASFNDESIGASPKGAVYLKYANGTTIRPVKEGPVQVAGSQRVVREQASAGLVARADCVKNSWVADAGRDDYTRPADGTQVVSTGVRGPATVAITKERSQSYTQTLGASLGFSDIVSLGVSFEESFTREISESKTYMFEVPDGQSGNVGFTPYLRCSTGSANCNGGSVSGEVCTPYKDSTGKLAGMYAVIQTSAKL